MGAIIYYTALNQTVDLGSEGNLIYLGYEVDEENSNNDMLLMNN